MNTDHTLTQQAQLTDRTIGISAHLMRQDSPEQLALLSPMQLQWYNFQLKFSNFESIPDLVAQRDYYMATFKPEAGTDTAQHRLYANHRMREYVCGEPTMIIHSPTYAWEVALADYKKCPEYTNENAIKARQKQEKEMKKQSAKDSTTSVGLANKEWRDGVRSHESAVTYWRRELETLTLRQEEEMRAFRAARDENIEAWKLHVATLREKYRLLRSQ